MKKYAVNLTQEIPMYLPIVGENKGLIWTDNINEVILIIIT